MDLKKISTIKGIDLLENVALEKFTTMRLGGCGTIAVCRTVESLRNLLLSLNNTHYRMLGWGANQVLLNTKDVLLVKLDFEFDKNLLKTPLELYTFPASVPLNLLSSHAQKFGLKGWEVFTGIPASLGGAICMNAGTALGEIGSVVKTVTIMNREGEIRKHEISPDCFTYRGNNFLKAREIIIEAQLIHKGIAPWVSDKIKSYLEYRKETQPLSAKTCGSVFKNKSPEVRAGSTIDKCGLKGFGQENLFVSFKHANFIEHHGGASASDFDSMLECLKIDIERYSGHKFELEVKVY